MRNIDWHLLLDFAKVAYGPTATLVGIYVAARLGVRAFKKQKALERRLDWFEKSYRLLKNLPVEFQLAALHLTLDSPEARSDFDKAMESALALANQLTLTILYTDEITAQPVAVLLGKLDPLILEINEKQLVKQSPSCFGGRGLFACDDAARIHVPSRVGASQGVCRRCAAYALPGQLVGVLPDRTNGGGISQSSRLCVGRPFGKSN